MSRNRMLGPVPPHPSIWFHSMHISLTASEGFFFSEVAETAEAAAAMASVAAALVGEAGAAARVTGASSEMAEKTFSRASLVSYACVFGVGGGEGRGGNG